jgi:hypothetical protein
MTQNALNHAVARATGESIACIARLGFSLVRPADHSEHARARMRRRRTPRRRRPGSAVAVRPAR